MAGEVLISYYARYLRDIAKVSETTVNKYLGAMKYISRLLKERGKVTENIYEIRSADTVKEVQVYLKRDPEFVATNTRGHQMYSSAINHYYKFASGADFVHSPELVNIMDIAIPKREKHNSEKEGWYRSDLIKEQVIEAAGYKCEINPSHSTFTSQKTNNPYMEGHHALPMRFQDQFRYSLDIYANVVCLCPVCHRLLHYGIKTEKKDPLDKIYYDRADRLAASGIEISREDFEKYAI